MIFDFNFFKSRREQVEKYVNQENYVKPVAVPAYDQGPAYQVGKTVDGSVTLRIGDSTLTMTNGGVETLVRILQAAVEDEE